MKKQLLVFLMGMSFSLGWASSKPLADGGVRDIIISGNISSYEGACPCPYSVDKHKDKCGENSAYNLYPGQIKCYPGDISDAEVNQYRQQYQIDAPKLPWEKDKKEGY